MLFTQSSSLTDKFRNTGQRHCTEKSKVSGNRRYRTAILAVSPYFSSSFEFRVFFLIFVDYFCYFFFQKLFPIVSDLRYSLLKGRQGDTKIH